MTTRRRQKSSRLSLALLCAMGLAALAMTRLAHASDAPPARCEAQRTLSGVLNVNTATIEQWQLLPGIGPSTAAKIVAYRTRRPFRSLTHLMRVKGIGDKTFAEIRPFLTLTGETTLSVQ